MAILEMNCFGDLDVVLLWFCELEWISRIEVYGSYEAACEEAGPVGDGCVLIQEM